MTSQTLREARKYEETSEKMIKKKIDRPFIYQHVQAG